MTPLALDERRAQLFWVGTRRPEVKAQDVRMVATHRDLLLYDRNLWLAT